MNQLVASIRRARERRPDRVFLLTEVKARSPRDGDLLRGRDPAALARQMVDAGADGISVVTEPDHFGGSLDLLDRVRDAVDVPVLVKDFVDSRSAVEAAAAHGADAVLLIVADLEEATLRDLYGACEDAGVDALVETHTRAEVELANDLGAPLVGINNRDIQALELDDGGVQRTERLAPLVRDGTQVVSESSLSSAADVRRARDAGADAALVGTAVLTAGDPAAAIRRLRPA